MSGRGDSTSLLGLTSTVSLTEAERAELGALADDLLTSGVREIDSPGWVRTARNLSCEVPRRVRIELRGYRRHSGDDGFLLLQGLPVDEKRLPVTPMVAESVQRMASRSASMLALIALQLGEVVAYFGEKRGALVQDVVPVAGMESMQGNAGSDELEFHVENAFHAERPDFICLLCLRPDRDGAAGLRVATYRKAVHLLSERDRQVLREVRFVTEAPRSFGGIGAAVRHAVLEGSTEDPDIRVDFATTRPADDDAARSMVELRKALARVQETLTLGAGDLAIVDNRIAAHGRTAFRPRYDGADRWLLRSYVRVNLRSSRALRPGDGHIVHADHPSVLKR